MNNYQLKNKEKMLVFFSNRTGWTTKKNIGCRTTRQEIHNSQVMDLNEVKTSKVKKYL